MAHIPDGDEDKLPTGSDALTDPKFKEKLISAVTKRFLHCKNRCVALTRFGVLFP